jgi:glycine dehydrogenase subunit 1
MYGYNTHRPEDKQAMLHHIGVKSMDALFDPVPDALRLSKLLALPDALSEWELERHMHALANKNSTVKMHNSFLGAGAYDHYIPAVVDAIVTRGEFLTSYTPYQPEISQGLLQALHEYQQSLAIITGLPVVNGSCYDGATAFADSAWACCLISGKQAQGELLVSDAIWPEYREVLDSYMDGRAVVRHTMPFDTKTGRIDVKKLDEMLAHIKPAGFLFQSPNALGIIEDIEAIAKSCARHGVISSCSFNPLAAGLLHSPGACGIDIVTCDGQPLGIPLSAGGPSLGVFATKKEYRAYVPGRLIGKVTDINGNLAYALVYEDREQHVARERATSNICSNQALNALRAVIYLASLGKQGFARITTLNTRKAHYLAEKLTEIKGVTLAFDGAYFNEFVITLPKPALEVLAQLEKRRIFGGVDYSRKFGLQSALLVCATEKKTRADMDAFADSLKEVLA